jgi:hypothetical protein
MAEDGTISRNPGTVMVQVRDYRLARVECMLNPSVGTNMRLCAALCSKVVFGVLAFAVLATAILTRIPKSLADFDQSFYLTIAYDIRHHGVFSNGIF